MLFLRSLLFNVYLYALTAILCVLYLPLLVLPGKFVRAGVRFWAKGILIGLRWIVGTRMEIRGKEHIPDKPSLIAFKHQSMWETVVIFLLFDRPAIVVKEELSFIPLYGWLMQKADTILVDRKAHAKALKNMARQAKESLKQNKPVIIFPEGSRAPPGEMIGYKPGIAALYSSLGVPCVPVALNSGLYWPRRRFIRRPGTVIIEFLPPIEPGLKRKQFMAELEQRIETASEKLFNEGKKELEDSGVGYSTTNTDRIKA